MNVLSSQRISSALFLALSLALSLVQCRSFTASAPVGFAVYEDSGLFSHEFKAITADGVRFRVREVKNEPEGDETLWKQTLTKGLEKKGFRIVSASTMRTDQGRNMQVMNSVLSAAGQDYAYLTAFVVNGKKIIVVEAGGPKELMSAHEKGLQESLRKLSIP